jgi:hypothetical protein
MVCGFLPSLLYFDMNKSLGVFAFKNKFKKICFLEFSYSYLAPHMLNTHHYVNNIPPLQPSHYYYPYSDYYEFCLVPKEWKTGAGMAGELFYKQDPSRKIMFDVDARNKILGVGIMNASVLIAKNQ